MLDEVWSRLRSVGVTGTKGKTTTAAMVHAIALREDPHAVLVSTASARVGAVSLPQTATTFAAVMAQAAAAGSRLAVVETVSLALASGWARRFPVDVAVFTNLLDDHRELHGDRDAYLAAKAPLFRDLRPPGVAVLPVADPAAPVLAACVPVGAEIHGVGIGGEPGGRSLALSARRVDATRSGLRIELHPGRLADALGRCLELRCIGAVNADNALAAATAAFALGCSPAAIRGALADFAGVAGRLEVVARAPWVIVDYAHIPDALERVLASVRATLDAEAQGGRLTVVFGCGGERSFHRRAPLGAVASRYADRIIVTSDNPRREDPAAIVADIERGLSGGAIEREPDRGRAIARAIAEAEPRDAAVIAGKGCEQVQEIAQRTITWSDVDAARAAVTAHGAPGRSP